MPDVGGASVIGLSNRCRRLRTSMDLEYPVFHDSYFPNRPVRPRMPGGVVGEQSIVLAPYPDGATRFKPAVRCSGFYSAAASPLVK